MSLLATYLTLLVAISFEVVGTSALTASNGFTRPGWVVAVVVCYAAAAMLMSLTLRVIPVGVVYATWAGVGILLVVAVGWLVFGQRLGVGALAGIGLIVVGVMVLHLSPGVRLP